MAILFVVGVFIFFDVINLIIDLIYRVTAAIAVHRTFYGDVEGQAGGLSYGIIRVFLGFGPFLRLRSNG
jgi:hypothetical protein